MAVVGGDDVIYKRRPPMREVTMLNAWLNVIVHMVENHYRHLDTIIQWSPGLPLIRRHATWAMMRIVIFFHINAHLWLEVFFAVRRMSPSLVSGSLNRSSSSQRHELLPR